MAGTFARDIRPWSNDAITTRREEDTILRRQAADVRAAIILFVLLITVTGSASATIPTAFFSYSPGAPAAGLPVQFTDTSKGSPTSWDWDFGDGGTSAEQNPTHVYFETGVNGVELTVSNPAGADTGTVLVTVFDEDFVIESVYLIPAASLARGAEGSSFRTDIDVTNQTSSDAKYTFFWLPRGADNSNPMTSFLLTQDSGVSARFENAFEELFGLEPDVNGAIGIVADTDGLTVFARIYNLQIPNVAGTLGQAIPGVPKSQLLGHGDVGRIIFMTEDEDFRANLGCANGSAENIRIIIDVYDGGDGDLLETRTMDLAPWSNKQINRIYRDLAPMVGSVEVRSDTPGAAYYCYGSVLDNTSNDPTTVEPVVYAGSEGSWPDGAKESFCLEDHDFLIP